MEVTLILRASARKRGDSLIEVMIAVALFSAVAVAAISVMNAGLGTAQLSLETTMARTEIDAQAEALRFIQESYASSKSTGSFSTTWQTIAKELAVNPAEDGSTPASDFSVCTDVYKTGNANSVYNKKAFVINTRTMNDQDTQNQSIIFPLNSTVSGIEGLSSYATFQEASVYPRIIYTNNSGAQETDGDLSSDANLYTTAQYVEGLWIVAVRDHAIDETKTGDAATLEYASVEYYDFYINACWGSSTSSVPTFLSTTIRLHNPDNITSVDAERASDYSLVFIKNTTDTVTDMPAKQGPIKSAAIDHTFEFSGTPQREGYNFLGWSKSSTATEPDEEFVDGSVTANYSDPSVELYAVWERNTCSRKITFDANGGKFSNNSTVAEQTVGPGECDGFSATLSSGSTPTRSGFVFSGWALTKTKSSADINNGDSYNFTSDLTVYAVWTAEQCTHSINYRYNSTSEETAVGSTNWPADQSGLGTCNESVSFTISSSKPSKTGYTFLGWSTTKNATSATYQAGGTISTTSSTTLYPVWKLNEQTLTLSFNLQDGSGSVQSQTCKISVLTTTCAPTIPTTKPTKSGYDFLGWSTSSTATTASYQPGGSISISKSTTLYAVWSVTVTKYSIIYNANGGQNAPQTQSCLVTSPATYCSIAITTSKPTRTNYDFLGWASSADSTTIAIQAGWSYGIQTNYNLYAIWAATGTYNLIFDTGMTGNVPMQSCSYSGTSTCTVKVPTTKPSRTGFSFLGWSQSYTASTATYYPGDQITLSSNKILYPVWTSETVNEYLITYDANGGTGAPETQQCLTSTLFCTTRLSTTVPVRSGYTFLGWGINPADTTATYQPNASVNFYPDVGNSFDLYAVWSKSLTLSFNANGGSGAPSSISRTTTASSYSFDIPSTAPTRDGYDFLGWSTSSTATAASYSAGGSITLSESDELFAVWKKHQYSARLYHSIKAYNTYGQGTMHVYDDYCTTNGSYCYKNTFTEDELRQELRGSINSTGAYSIYLNNPLAGWSLTQGSISVDYEPGERVSIPAPGTTYVYAVFEPVLSFDANGGTGAPSSTSCKFSGAASGTSSLTTYTCSAQIPATTPTKSGYTFYGWSTSPSATSVSYSADDTVTLSENTTLYAVWEINGSTKAFTLFFNANRGYDAPSSITHSTTSSSYSFTIPTDTPSRYGCTFAGWATSASATSAMYVAGDSITISQDTTLYAVWRKTYTVSFNAVDGSGAPSSVSCSIDGWATSGTCNVTIPTTTPTKSGYTFAGWSEWKSTTGAIYAPYQPGQTVLISGNDTLYAVWADDNPRSITVNFYGLDGNYRSVSCTTTTETCDITTPTDTPTQSSGNTGTFLGWRLNNFFYSPGDSIKVYGAIPYVMTAYGVWSGSSVNNAKLQLSLGALSSSASFFYGSCSGTGYCSIATPTSQTLASLYPDILSNLNLVGWSATENDEVGTTTVFFAPGESIDVTNRASLAAVWEANLSFDANNGTNAPATASCRIANSYYWSSPTPVTCEATIPSTIPTRSGYTFLGWSTSSSATTATYQPGDSLWISEHTKLYAVWSKSLTLSFSANGGSGAPSSITRTTTASSYSFDIPSTAPTRSGYTFLGWSTSSSATSASYAVNGSITISQDTTLYAVWQTNTKLFSLFFSANGGSGAPDSTYCQTTGTSCSAEIPSTAPTRSGYTFLGWSTSSSATSASYAVGGSMTISQNTTLYAVWKSSTQTFVLDYYNNGGSGAPGSQVCTTSVSYCSLTLTSNVPTRDGYLFLGWSTSSSATSASYAAGSSITIYGSTNLYAVWKYGYSTLTLDANGGSGGPGSVTGTCVLSGSYYLCTFTLPYSTPTRSGYTFRGWGFAKSYDPSTFFYYGPGEQINLLPNETMYAAWS